MKMEVLAVYDIQAGVYMQPMFCQSTGVGVRMLTDEVNRQAQDNVLYQHPEDFRLFRLGAWDNVAGVFEGSNPSLVVDASTLKR